MTPQAHRKALREHHERVKAADWWREGVVGDGGRGGGGLDGVGLQSAVDCLLGGWCDVKLAARLAARGATMRAGRRVSGAADVVAHILDITTRQEIILLARPSPSQPRPLLGGCILSVHQTLMSVPAQEVTIHCFPICISSALLINLRPDILHARNVSRGKYDVL